MADDADRKDIGALPPKLDLRRDGILKDAQPAGPGPQAQGKAPRGVPDAKKQTSRIPLEVATGAGAGAAKKKQTSRIPLDAAKPAVTPAEPVPREPAAPAAAGDKPSAAPGQSDTLRIEIRDSSVPAEEPRKPLISFESSAPAKPSEAGTKQAGPAKPTAVAGAGAAKKKQTSRIPFDAAEPAVKPAKPAQAPKTIRIKPSRPAGGAKAGGPGPVAPAPAAGAAAPKPDAEKRKTSRISLEAALSAEESAEKNATIPKTIKLRRPSEAPTVKVSPGRPGSKAPKGKPAEEAARKTAMSETARLDTQTPAEEGVTPTKRKTIRVKRPSAAPGVKGLSVAPPADTGGVREASALEAPPVVEKTSWVFPVVALVAVLVVCVVIYMLAAQALGPRNASLTKLSYGAEWLDLGWPGKLPKQ